MMTSMILEQVGCWCYRRGDGAVDIFMDLSKAFDIVSHDGLLDALQQIGISGVALK